MRAFTLRWRLRFWQWMYDSQLWQLGGEAVRHQAHACDGLLNFYALRLEGVLLDMEELSNE